MPLAIYVQALDPFDNRILSTVVAAAPVGVLFYLLVVRRWPAPFAGLGGSVTAVLAAWLAFGLPLPAALMAFAHGAAFGLMPIGWTVFAAMLLYNLTVETGQFAVLRRSVGAISADARLQAILIGFSFGAFLEGAAGAGTPVAICGAVLVGLGFKPFQAAVLCLIANTSPVAWGGLGIPLITLSGVTDIPVERLSVMAAHQLPLLSCLVPLWMVRCMVNWKQTIAVWPALAVAGGSFALCQYFFGTSHTWIRGLVLYPMTDIGGGIISLVATAVFLKFWKPRQAVEYAPAVEVGPALTTGRALLAWAPYLIMSLLLMGSGLVRQQELKSKGEVYVGPVRTTFAAPVPWLHHQVQRADELREPGRPVELEPATFSVAWVTAPGSPVFAAFLLSLPLLRPTRAQLVTTLRKTVWQMRIPIPTIAFMLGLSYVTRYSGMDATLGVAFAATGMAYPFFAALLGWLGVFLTGTDAGSNALFGSLQKITATQVYAAGAFEHLDLSRAQTLVCTTNSTGGVMGKMIDAQSICVATAATHQVGREADIFQAVIWHSIALASIVGGLTLLQAYVRPFVDMVP